MGFEAERETVVQQLCHAFAHDRLTTEELEARLEAAYKAASADELHATLVGLPALAATPGAPHATHAGTLDHYTGAGVVLAEAGQRVLSVFGSVKKSGDWEPAPRTRAIAVFAEVELDFRSALIGPGVTTVDISCVFAEVRIIVPPGLRVECDGSAILGEFSEKTFGGLDPSDEAPTLRITGQAVFGTVSVSMRLPSETARQARKRERRG